MIPMTEELIDERMALFAQVFGPRVCMKFVDNSVDYGCDLGIRKNFGHYSPVGGAFLWSDTPEGSLFWSEINKEFTDIELEFYQEEPTKENVWECAETDWNERMWNNNIPYEMFSKQGIGSYFCKQEK